jgi:hypothetical protein
MMLATYMRLCWLFWLFFDFPTWNITIKNPETESWREGLAPQRARQDVPGLWLFTTGMVTQKEKSQIQVTRVARGGGHCWQLDLVEGAGAVSSRQEPQIWTEAAMRWSTEVG